MSFYFDRKMECVIAVGSIKNWHNSTKAVIYRLIEDNIKKPGNIFKTYWLYILSKLAYNMYILH